MMRPEELKQKMKGVFCVQMTPFTQDGSLDLEAMRANTRWLQILIAGKLPPKDTDSYLMIPAESRSAPGPHP